MEIPAPPPLVPSSPETPQLPDIRYRWAWVLVWLLLGFMMVSAVGSYLDPEGGAALTPSQRIEKSLNDFKKEGRRVAQSQSLMAGSASFSPKVAERIKDRLEPLYLDSNPEPKLTPSELDDLARLHFAVSRVTPIRASMRIIDHLNSKPGLNAYRFAAYPKPGEDALENLKNWKPKDEVDRFAKALALEKAGQKNSFAGLSEGPPKGTMQLAGVVIILLVLGGLAAWVLYGVLRLGGIAKPLGHPAGEMTGGEADANATRFLFYLLLLIGGMSIVVSIFRTFLPKEVANLIATSIGIVLVIFVANMRLNKRPWSANRVFGPDGFRAKHILWGFGGFLANVPIILFLLVVTLPLHQYLPEPTHPINEILSGPNTSLMTWIVVVFSAVIFAPITEEIAFRGLLTPALGKVLGSVVIGIVLNGFVFAAIHPQGPLLWLMLGWVGAMGAMLTYQTRSLYPAILMHAFHNGTILAVGLLAR